MSQEGGGANINERSVIGSTVLHFAAERGHIEMVQWLLQPMEQGGVAGRVLWKQISVAIPCC